MLSASSGATFIAMTTSHLACLGQCTTAAVVQKMIQIAEDITREIEMGLAFIADKNVERFGKETRGMLICDGILLDCTDSNPQSRSQR